MKVILTRNADKEYKTGDPIKFEVEISQEELDGIFRERLTRHKATADEEKAAVQTKLDAATAKIAEAEGKATAAEQKATAAEARATEAEEKAGKQLTVTQKEKQVLTQLLGDGVSLPEVYLSTIKVEAADTDEQIKAKVKAVVDKFKADLAKHGGGRTMGTDNNGAGGGDDGWSDSELVALAKKEFRTLVQNAGSDAKVLELMRQKAKNGELKKPGTK